MQMTHRILTACALAGLAGSAAAQLPTLSTQLVASGFSSPVFVDQPPGVTDRLYVVQQGGTIRIIENGSTLPGNLISAPTNLVSGGEQGLLGLAFHPDFVTNGLFYLHYTVSASRQRVSEYEMNGSPLTATTASLTSKGILLEYNQDFSNHNAGMIAFGPDDMLYVSTGDGGSGGDPNDRAQNRNSYLGKMLRIDINGDDFPADALRDYAIPAGQPSFGGLPELWQIGLRNPWRWSFDSGTGDMWIGDVGQNAREEVNYAEAGTSGQNWGWRCREGTVCGTSSTTGPCNCFTSGLVDPIHDFPWNGGASVIGGYVYRGPEFCLDGLYFFANLNPRRIWAGELNSPTSLTVTEVTSQLVNNGASLGGSVFSFGSDNAGNVYIVTSSGQIHRITTLGGCPSTAVDLCNGDGGDQMGCTDCPCSNNAAPGTIGGCLNDIGASARIQNSGNLSASNDSFSMTMQGGTPNSFAVMTSGSAVAPQGAANPCFGQNSGIAQPTLLDGLRCAVQGVLRHGSRSINNFGFASTWGPPGGPAGGLVAASGWTPGTTRYFQVIYRSMPGTLCGNEQNTSQAVEVTVVP